MTIIFSQINIVTNEEKVQNNNYQRKVEKKNKRKKKLERIIEENFFATTYWKNCRRVKVQLIKSVVINKFINSFFQQHFELYSKKKNK